MGERKTFLFIFLLPTHQFYRQQRRNSGNANYKKKGWGLALPVHSSEDAEVEAMEIMRRSLLELSRQDALAFHALCLEAATARSEVGAP
jgi:hypothetical protein